MGCRDCPYGVSDFELKMSMYHYIVSKDGISNGVFGDMQSDEFAGEVEEFLWCDKVDGKLCYAGYCSDADKKNDIQTKAHTRKKKNKYERNLKHKTHLINLWKRAGEGYPCPVVYTDEKWIRGKGWVSNPKPYYKRYYRTKQSSYLKKQSNKRVRRYKDEPYNGCQYRRLFDFWWEYC